jgi:hypothetical protein
MATRRGAIAMMPSTGLELCIRIRLQDKNYSKKASIHLHILNRIKILRRDWFSAAPFIRAGVTAGSVPLIMSEAKPKAGRPSLLGVFKEIFNWYPSEYPSEERRSVERKYNRYYWIWTDVFRLLFKLDLSILIFACLCCEFCFITVLNQCLS